MITLNMPGFTAEESLYRPSGHYQTDRRAIKSSREMINMVRAAETSGEVINVHSCPPGYIEVGSGDDAFCTEGPGLWWNGMGGGNWPPDVPPGGGGGGGGGTPVDVPADIVRDCKDVGGINGQKLCGGIVGPCKHCAQIRCQQKKCEATKRCNPVELDDVKRPACDELCPDVPRICKDGLIVKSSVSTGGLTRGLGGVSRRI